MHATTADRARRRPAWCPCVSFVRLKWSTSSRSRPNGSASAVSDGLARATSGSCGGSRAPSAGRCSTRARRETRASSSSPYATRALASAAAMPSCASLRVVTSETMPSATTPPGSRRQRQRSTSQRMRPSPSQMRYSTLPGRPACCAASTSSRPARGRRGGPTPATRPRVCAVVDRRAEEGRHRHRLEVDRRRPVDREPPGVEVLVDRGEHGVEPSARGAQRALELARGVGAARAGR